MLSQYEYQRVMNIVGSMIQAANQVPDQIKNHFMAEMQQNPQIQQEVASVIDKACPPQQRGQAGLHDNDYRQILHGWINQRLGHYMQLLQQQQQQQQAGFFGQQQAPQPRGFPQQAYGTQGLVGGAQSNPMQGAGGGFDIYGTNTPCPPQTPQAPQWSAQHPVSQPYESPTMPQQPAPTPEPKRESLDLEIGTEQEVAPRAKDIQVNAYKIGGMNNYRFSIVALSTWRAFNNDLDVFKYVYRNMPLTAYQGRWAWVIEYPEFIHIPMATQKFLDLRKKAQASYEDTKDWAAALAAIGNEVPRNVWKTLNESLTTEWNRQAMTYLRDASNIGAYTDIDVIDEDVQELLTSPQKVSVGSNPNFVQTVSTLADEAVRALLVDNTFEINNKKVHQIITDSDANVGDILFTDGIHMTKNGLTERDFGISPTTVDTTECLKDIFDTHTVLRKRRSVLITNVVSHQMQDGLFGNRPFEMTTHLKGLLRGLQSRVVTHATKGLILDPSKGPDKDCVPVTMGWPMGPQGPTLDEGFMIPSDRTLGW